MAGPFDKALASFRSIDRLDGPLKLDFDSVALRVICDLFAARTDHPADDLASFEAIALRLAASADRQALAQAVRRIAAHPQLPRALKDRLLRQGGEPAAVLLEHAGIDGQMLVDVCAGGDALLAAAVARRADLDRGTVELLSERPEAGVLAALAANRSAPLSPLALGRLELAAQDSSVVARAFLDRVAQPSACLPLFMQASRPQRRAMLQDLKTAHPAPAARMQPDAAALETIASGDWSHLPRLLVSALELPEDLAYRIVADEGGEALALALGLLGIRAEDAAPVFSALPAAHHRAPEDVRWLLTLLDPAMAPAARQLFAALKGELAGRAPGAARPQARRREDKIETLLRGRGAFAARLRAVAQQRRHRG